MARHWYFKVHWHFYISVTRTFPMFGASSFWSDWTSKNLSSVVVCLYLHGRSDHIPWLVEISLLCTHYDDHCRSMLHRNSSQRRWSRLCETPIVAKWVLLPGMCPCQLCWLAMIFTNLFSIATSAGWWIFPTQWGNNYRAKQHVSHKISSFREQSSPGDPCLRLVNCVSLKEARGINLDNWWSTN